MPKRPRWVPLDHDCPRCEQPPGAHCTTPKGTRASRLHASRRRPPNLPTPLPGRKPLIEDPDVREIITTHLSNFTPAGQAAAAAGVHPATLYRWLAEADKPEAAPVYREFRDTLTRARAEAAAEILAEIKHEATWHLVSEEPMVTPGGKLVTDGDGNMVVKQKWGRDWRAGAFLLERAFPAEWGKRQTVAVESGDGLVPAAVSASVGSQGGVDPVALVRIRESMRAWAREQGWDVPDDEGIQDAEVVEG